MASSASPSWVIMARVPRVTAADTDLPQSGRRPLPRAAAATARRAPHHPPAHPPPQSRPGPRHGPHRHRPPRPPGVSWRPTVAGYFILDAKSASAVALPDAKYIMHPGHLGLVASPADDGHYMVAELQMIIGGDTADLLCFSSHTGEWVSKDVPYPLPPRPLSPSGVVALSGRLWWVDLSWCLLTCDPFADAPTLTVVPLPEGRALQYGEAGGLLDKYRCVGVSAGKLRFVDMYRNRNSAGAAQITVWTLADPDSTEWTLEYEATFAEICNDASFKAAGLPRKIPVLALIHPINPDVLYFFLDERMVGVDVRARKVVDCEVYELVEPPREHVSSRFVHAWQLPPALCSGSAKETEDGGVNDELQQLLL